jgi:SPP1 family predicted phage head-tail adaptor
VTNPGELDQRISLQSATPTQSATTGEVSDAWATVATVWASVEPLGAREIAVAQTFADNISYKVRIRDRAVTARQRIVWGSRTLSIDGVLPSDRTGYRVLFCSEVA